MLYDSTKCLLRGILQSLENPTNVGWDDQVESGRQCLYEMHQMARPEYKGYRTEGPNGKPAGPVPVSAKVTRAIPHVKIMVSAIRRRDQATALQSGKAALAEM
jgi:hypothetical protein